MSKKKEQHISKNEQQLLDGIEIVKNHPLFGRLKIYQYIRGKAALGNAWAKTNSCAILLNREVSLTPSGWAYVIAHCMLHLSFGHFDAMRMPGYFNENNKWIVDCDFELWNMACDIYICRFLNDIKFGTSYVRNEDQARFKSASGEIKIYDNLLRENVSASDNVFGTSGKDPDMIQSSSPIFYENNQKNEYMTQFAFALADSVRTVINKAGNVITDNTVQTEAHKAALWFINHYPLLGGIASGFKIIDTRQTNLNLGDISIAAVNVIDGEIYVNRAAGLNFEEWKFVLAHEYLHAGLQHHARRQGRDPELWNAACDFVINSWLYEMHIGQMPSRGLLYDPDLKNMSAEEIYDELIKNIRKNRKLETFRGIGKGDIIADGYIGDLNSPTTLDEFCKNALRSGLEYHEQNGRGFIPAGLIEEIRALSVPPIPWDVQLAQWFDIYFAPLEKRRSYARPSRRQSSVPDIPMPRLVPADIPEHSRTYGVIIDTSGSMSLHLIGLALGAAASYSAAKEVPYVRVVFCDAAPYDIGYVSPEDIAGRVRVEGRGGTVLQPAVDLLQNAGDFPKNAPILIITDGFIEDDLRVRNEHAFLIPEGHRLPFHDRGKVFYFK